MGKEVQTNVGVKLLKFGRRFIHRKVVEVVERDLMKLYEEFDHLAGPFIENGFIRAVFKMLPLERLAGKLGIAHKNLAGSVVVLAGVDGVGNGQGGLVLKTAEEAKFFLQGGDADFVAGKAEDEWAGGGLDRENIVVLAFVG
jgi:hypothetical protein